MRKILSVLIIILFAFGGSLLAQKTIAQYTVQELTTKKAEAIAAKETSDAAVYDAALMLREELAGAIKVEDYDKATAIQEQLKALKLKPSTAQQEKEIQDQINKAVAAEDYDLAQSLKLQLAALKNPVESPTPVKETKPVSSSHPSNNSAQTKNNAAANTNTNSNSGLAVLNNLSAQSMPVARSSSSLSREAIYGSGVTYMGLDLSLVNLVSPKKLGQEQKLFKYIVACQKSYDKDVDPKKLAHWLSKSELNDESANVEGLYTSNTNRSWIIADAKTVSQSEIETQLATYKSSHQGIALVMIPSLFDEKRHELTLNVVWFDLGSRAVVSLQSVTVRATTWPAALTDATKKYVDQYYKKRQ